MATDRDDEIARRSRALATEEPGPALDDAILAKSRRAVGARPGGFRRWGPPLSIAAVLVLASGVVIRMQAEKPGLETSAPAREESRAPAVAPEPRAPVAMPEAVPASKDVAPPAAAPPSPARAQLAPPAPEKKRVQAAAPTPSPSRVAPTEDRYVPEPPARDTERVPAATMQSSSVATPAPSSTPPAQAPSAAGVAASPPPPAARRAPMQLNATQPSAADAPAADMSRAAAAPGAKEAPRLKQESRALATTPEAALDRIAELRAAGRDDEADRALEEFRRAYPDYRLGEAQLERVRRRAP